MYKIIVSGGKQYRVSLNDVLEVERLDKEEGEKVELEAIFTSDGTSFVAEKSVVTAEILSHGKGKKITVFKYKPKKNIRKKQGHRQLFTKVKITAL